MDTQSELLRFLVRALEALDVRYALTGSIASSIYGEPRATRDIDVVAELNVADIDRLRARFPTPDFYLEVDTAREAVRSGGEFNIIHPYSGYKIDIFVARTASERRQVDEARELVAEEVNARFTPPEDLIVNKLRYYKMGASDKHLRDIAAIMQISGSEVDYTYVDREVARLDLREIWDAVRGRVEEG